MHLWFLSAMALGIAAPSASSQSATNPERAAVVGVVSAYHDALQAGQAQKVVELLGPTYFMADEHSGLGSDRLSAHMFLTGDKLKSWPGSFLQEVGPYRNDFAVLSVSIRGDAAVVLTRDTGSNRFRSWRDEEVAWFLGRIAGRWRIGGLLIRDIQLPK